MQSGTFIFSLPHSDKRLSDFFFFDANIANGEYIRCCFRRHANSTAERERGGDGGGGGDDDEEEKEEECESFLSRRCLWQREENHGMHTPLRAAMREGFIILKSGW